MLKPRTVVAAAIFTLCLFLVGVNAYAQTDPVDPLFEQGFTPFGSFQFGNIDSVDLLNKGLNLQIPLYSVPQRGGKLHMDFSLMYVPDLWVPYQYDSDCSGSPCYSYSNSGPALTVGNDFAFRLIDNYDPPFSTSISVTSPDGASHRIGYPFSRFSVDATGYQTGAPVMASCPYTDGVTDRNGISYKFGCTTSDYYSSQFAYYEDPNGNKLTLNVLSNNWTDTMGRTVSDLPYGGASTTDYSGCTGPGSTVLAVLYSLPGLSGGTETLKFCYANVMYYQNLHLCKTDRRCDESSDAGAGNPALQSVVLPNGTSWTFEYASANPSDPNSVGWGDLKKITLPTGGSIAYTWTSAGLFSPCATGYPLGSPVRRVVASRALDANDGQGPHTWTYTTSTSGPLTTTVQDPAGNQSVYTFAAIPNGTSTPSCMVHQTLMQSYQGTSTTGTLLQTNAYDYAKTENYGSVYPPDDPDFVVSRVTTTLASGQKKKVETDYSYTLTDDFAMTDGNIVARREYDYGPSAPGGLLRTTTTAYIAESNSNYLSHNLLSLPSSEKVQNGSGTQVGYTTFGYDEYSLVSGGITIQHDLSPPNGSYRGNQTSMHRWLNGSTTSTTNCPISVSNGYLTSYNLFFDTGMVQKATDSCGTAVGDANHTTTYAYAPTSTCATNFIGAFPTAITNPLGQATNYCYDFNTGLTTSTTDPNQQSTNYQYDSMLRLMNVTYPDAGSDSYSYNDTVAYPTSPSFAFTKKITTSTNLVETGIVDGLGRPMKIKATVPSSTCSTGFSYVDTAYDNEGRKFSVSNPYCTTGDATYGLTKTYYDALNRPCLVVPPDGTMPSGNSCPATSPGNDIFNIYSGNCTIVTDQASKGRKTCVDGLGRMTGVWEDPSGLNYETDYTYDALDDLLSVAQSASRQRTFVYDSLSRLLCAANPEIQIVTCPNPDTGSYTAGTVRYGYDADGNVTSKTAPKPNQTSTSLTVTTTYAYESLNRLLSKTYSDGTPTALFSYDQTAPWGFTLTNPIGRLTTSGTNNGAWLAAEVLSYDPLGRVSLNQQCTTCSRGWSFSMGYSYDYLGDITSHDNGAFPVGQGVTFTQTFDTAGRQTSLTSTYNDSQHPATLATIASYWPFGQVSKMTYGNGVMESSIYESRLQPCRMTFYSSGTPTSTCTKSLPTGNIQDFGFAYGTLGSSNNGNVTYWEAFGNQGFTRTYSYDSLNRISSLSDGVTTNPCPGLSWTYDPWANLKTKTQTLGTCGSLNLTYDGKNHITNTGLQYDASGNLTNDGTHSYTFDAENRITAVDGGSTASYVYNAHGQRVLKTAGGVTTEYYHDLSGNVLGEAQGTTVTTGYVYLNQQLLAEYTGGTTYFVHQDHLGSTRLMTNVSGCVVDSLDYLPFGERNSVGSVPCSMADTTHKFTSKERDAESGLDNFGARYDSSQYGRFMTPDPLGGHTVDPQTLNKYAYVRNNPINLTDPTGLDFYLGCKTDDHSGCTQVQIDPHNKDKTWVQSGKDGNATIVTSDSIRNGTNSATVNQNGVQVTTGGSTSEGVYFDNPASHTTDANGSDVNHNPIQLQGDASKSFGGFSFNINGNCGGTCLSSGSFGFNGTPAQARAALKAAGSWDYGIWDALNSTPFGHHPYTDQFRFGSGPSSHVSVPLDIIPGGSGMIVNPWSTVPATGDFHTDATVGFSHAACANIPGVSCN